MEAIMEGGAALTTPDPRGLCVRLPGGAQMDLAAAGQVKLAAQLLRALAEGSRPC